MISPKLLRKNRFMSNLVDEIYEFPCAYVIKAIGEDDGGLEDLVRGIITERLEPDSDIQTHSRPSSGGRYSTISVSFLAESREQLEDMYGELNRQTCIKFLL